jgi:hypothetical protein
MATKKHLFVRRRSALAEVGHGGQPAEHQQPPETGTPGADHGSADEAGRGDDDTDDDDDDEDRFDHP